MRNLILLLAISIGFIACNQLDSIKEEGRNNELHNSKTLSELSSFNTSILNDKSLAEASTRGWWDDLKGILIVSAADVAGVGAGISSVQGVAITAGIATGGTGYIASCGAAAAVCSAGASLLAYQSLPTATEIPFEELNAVELSSLYLNNTIENKQKLNIKGYKYNHLLDALKIPAEYEYLKRVGEDHNKIVTLSFEKKSTATRTSEITEVELIDIPPVTKQEYAVISELLNNNEFKSLRRSINNSVKEACYDETFDVDTFFRNSNIESKRVEEALKLYLSLYVDFPENLEDIVIIINGYIDIIEKNEDFTNSDKEAIYAALITSLYSPQIWETK